MTLPTIDLPIHTIRLPSTDKEIRIRPFVVKEEKLLLMALAGGDLKEIIATVKQVISNCIIDELNIDKLPFFDMDYLFIALRAKSVGETIDAKFRCLNVVEEDGKPCNNRTTVPINISNVTVSNLEQEKMIKVSPKITIEMKYPSYAVMKGISEKDPPVETKIKYIMASIARIFDGDDVYDVKDYTKEELQAFVEGLTEEQFVKLETFVDNYPEFSVVVSYTCDKCSFKHNMRYTDFSDFFQ